VALKVELKPGERIILGDCVITNADQRTRLLIEGHMPILREKDILTPERADSPAKRIYLAVQLMYMSKDARAHHDIYFSLLRDILKAAPSVWPYIEDINNRILTGDTYKALRSAKKLIAYEEELLSNAKSRTRLRNSGQANGKPARA
jgi:flagellar biosynthesis repressor protein FlbT